MAEPSFKDDVTQIVRDGVRDPLSAPPVEIGRVLQDFVLEAKIGEGGAGLVFRAQQVSLGRDVILKVIRASALDHAAKQRFVREAHLASRLDHPYAAHIYAFGVEEDGLMWIAMEYVRGVSLKHYIDELGPLPLRRFVPLFERICEVLHAAHGLGIVHRDIKPSNIMIMARAGRLLPKLLDFGIAKAVNLRHLGHKGAVALVTEGEPSGALDGSIEEAPATEPDPLSSSEGDMDGRSASAETSGNESSGLLTLGALEDQHTLTQVGTVLGSPAFMAPEQWAKSDEVDERTDIYALGVLAYNLLTGKLPFQKRSIRSLRKAHQIERPPALPPSVPAKLDAVIQRALAKNREDRFASALEFATAVRNAAGLFEGDNEQAPRLERDLFERCITAYPQPLAETIAALDAVRNFDHARNAALAIVNAAARCLAFVSLSCHAALKRDEKRLSSSAQDLLLKACEHDLDAREWIALTQQTCADWASAPELHLVPELVRLCHPAGEEDRFDLLESVTALQTALSDTKRDPQELLRNALGSLEALLRSLAFLADYLWLVPAGDVFESWMGMRRQQRQRIFLALDGTPGAWLATADSLPLARLWPLVETAIPSPGAAPELFWLAGKGRSGARLVAEPQGFVHDSEHVWPWLGEHFLDHAPSLQREAAAEHAPYKGLSTFTPDDHSLFFGRERETEAVLNRLQRTPTLAIVGPSGSGKSSLVFAGIVPNMAGSWTIARFRPGLEPLRALESALKVHQLDLGPQPSEATEVARRLHEQLTLGQRRLLLVVDQFEELFTQGTPVATQNDFAALLLALAQRPDDPIRVIVTLRDDFLIRAEELATLRGKLVPMLHLLTTPSREDLLRILVEPARRVGYRFEDDSFPEEIVQEVEGRPGALALLSFAASALWDARETGLRRLPRRAYREMGGVGGALAQHAERTLFGLEKPQQAVVREVFRHLVTSEGTRAVLPRADARELLGEATDAVLEHLLAARLLVATEGSDGADDTIEISHEALLGAWPRLVNWRLEDAEGARLRDQLRAAARQWDERAQARGMLWRGEALAELQLWRRRHPQALTQLESAFVAASEGEASRGRRIRRGLLIGTVVGLTAVGAVLYWQRGIALEHKQLAEEQEGLARDLAQRVQARLAQMHLENARRELLASRPYPALAYLAEAAQAGAKGLTFDVLAADALAVTERRRAVLPSHEGGVLWASYDANGRQLVITGAGGRVEVWNTDPLELRHSFAQEGPVYRADFSPDGSHLVLSEGGGAVVRSLETGDVVLRLEHKPVAVRALLTADRVAVAGLGAAAGLWSFPGGERIADLRHDNDSLFAQFNDAGTLLLTGERSGAARLWDAKDGALRHTLDYRGGQILRGDFDSTGEWVVTSHYEGDAVVWSTQTGRIRHRLSGHRSKLRDTRFSPDGTRIATTSEDGAARLYDANTGALLHTLVAHEGQVMGARFLPDGDSLLTAGQDGQVLHWDVGSGVPVAAYGGHIGSVQGLAVHPSGQAMITGGDDGNVFLWTLEDRDLLTDWAAHEAPLSAMRLSSDAKHVLTASRDGELALWRTEDGGQIHSVAPEGMAPYRRVSLTLFHSAASHPNGRTIAVSTGQEVALWDLERSKLRPAFAVDDEEFYALAHSRAGDVLVAAGFSGTLYSWDGTAAAAFETSEPHTAPVWNLSLSGDGRMLASASEDAKIKLWDMAARRLRLTLRGHTEGVRWAEFDASGTRVVSASDDKTGRIWDAQTGDMLVALEGHRSHLRHATFSPDGRLVATAGGDGELILWNAETGEMLSRRRVDGGALDVVRFDPTSSTLWTGGHDGHVRRWRYRVETASEGALATAARCHTPYELRDERLRIASRRMEGCPGAVDR